MVLSAAMGSAWAAWAIVGLAAGLFLSFVGALGSFDYPLTVRLAFWWPLCLVAALIAYALETALRRVKLADQRRALRWFAFVPLFALIMTPVVFGASALVGSPTLPDMIMFFQNSVVISAAYVSGRLLVGAVLRPTGRPSPEAAEAHAPGGTGFMDRLPDSLAAARLIALSAEGHYLRVHTSAGSALILMRLKDAVSELRTVPGLQIHRSWWVAADAVIASSREEGRLSLKLKCGLTAPVSRSNREKVKSLGWA